MRFQKLNEEVLLASDNFIKIERKFIQILKEKAANTARKRIRICIHKNSREILQEMFIVHMKDAYVRPHKHLTKSESLLVVEGRADIILFDEKGRIKEIVEMGDYLSGYDFYYKLKKPDYHTMLIKSAYLVFQEVTKGPFHKSGTQPAPWAPEENDTVAVKEFLTKLADDVKNKGKS